jgi:hypothetical protein
MKFTADEHLRAHHCMAAASHTAAATTGTPFNAGAYTEGLALINYGTHAANAELDVTVYHGTTRTLCVTTMGTFQQVLPANDLVTKVLSFDMTQYGPWVNLHFKADGANAALASGDLIFTGAKNQPTTQATDAKGDGTTRI